MNMLKPTKATKSVKASVVKLDDVRAPAVYVNDSEGNQCGILNLHLSIKDAWDTFPVHVLGELQDELFLEDTGKGTVLCSMEEGRKIQLAWVNGKPEAKEAFVAKLGNEMLTFKQPMRKEALGRFSC
jgi:hypothetical protein